MTTTRNFVHIHTGAAIIADPSYDSKTDTCHWCRTDEADTAFYADDYEGATVWAYTPEAAARAAHRATLR